MDTPEVIETEATSPRARRFRTWRIAVIALGTVCLATAGVWLLQPSSQDASARRVLNPQTESETDASPADSTSTSDLLDDVSTVTTEGPTSTDPLTDEVSTTSPALMNGGVPNGRYWAAYARGMCDEGFAFPSCLEAIEQYCAQSAPSPWTLPDLTGRPLLDTLTQTEIEHAYADDVFLWSNAKSHDAPPVRVQCRPDSARSSDGECHRDRDPSPQPHR